MYMSYHSNPLYNMKTNETPINMYSYHLHVVGFAGNEDKLTQYKTGRWDVGESESYGTKDWISIILSSSGTTSLNNNLLILRL